MTVRLRLGDIAFTWEPVKAASNVTKHGITFEEAATTWLDRFALERFDATHSAEEERWLRIGSSLRGAILVAWSTERPMSGQIVVRIVGARRANRREVRLYEQGGEDAQ